MLPWLRTATGAPLWVPCFCWSRQACPNTWRPYRTNWSETQQMSWTGGLFMSFFKTAADSWYMLISSMKYMKCWWWTCFFTVFFGSNLELSILKEQPFGSKDLWELWRLSGVLCCWMSLWRCGQCNGGSRLDALILHASVYAWLVLSSAILWFDFNIQLTIFVNSTVPRPMSLGKCTVAHWHISHCKIPYPIVPTNGNPNVVIHKACPLAQKLVSVLAQLDINPECGKLCLSFFCIRVQNTFLIPQGPMISHPIFVARKQLGINSQGQLEERQVTSLVCGINTVASTGLAVARTVDLMLNKKIIGISHIGLPHNHN